MCIILKKLDNPKFQQDQDNFTMSTQVNISEAKSKLSKLINQVIAGEEVIIAKSGKPVAKIVPFEKPAQNRKPGSAKGKIAVSDDFDAPLPSDRSFRYNPLKLL